MAFYNKLSEVSTVSYPRLMAWRFRVKLHMIYSFHSYVTNSGPYYTYVLADENGYKMEMTVYGDYENFKRPRGGRGKMCGNLSDTMGVVFNTEARFDLATPMMVFYIRDNIQIKCVATGEQAYAFWDGLEKMGRGQVIVALKMWRVRKLWNCSGPDDLSLETEGGISDFRFNPRLSEVEHFRQSLLNSDPYVKKYGVEGLV
ncbi:unnamed protein product [Brassica rapa subsp. narinosa]